MKTLQEHTLNKAIAHHIENEIPFYENVFRPHTDLSNKLFREARSMFKEGLYEAKDWFEEELLGTDIGDFDLYEGESVPLDFPLVEEDEKTPELNKPKRGGGDKKYVVYVKNPQTGNIKKISFGDVKGGLTSKINDPEARKNFASRHNCADKTDKMSAGYWACRLPRYAKSLGLSGGGNFFW